MGKSDEDEGSAGEDEEDSQLLVRRKRRSDNNLGSLAESTTLASSVLGGAGLDEAERHAEVDAVLHCQRER